MEPFTAVQGRAAPLLVDAVNTDLIYPARFLLLTEKRNLGKYLFHDWRRGPDGELTGAFVLDRPAFRGAPILIAGAAFGCGSSREQAVWTLLDAGIRCVIAPSFGEIFYANCFENGLLPITLPTELVLRLAEGAEAGAEMSIDLTAQTLDPGEGEPMSFPVPPDRKAALLRGLDAIDEVLGQKHLIEAFEIRRRAEQPWLFTRLA